MIKRIIAAAVLAVLAAVSLQAREKVVFMPQWHPQAQFAGYYVAQEKGFFAEENLDVEIKHPSQSTNKSAVEFLTSGEVDIITAQFISAIVAKENGVDFANILQTSQRSALCCVSHKPIKGVADFEGLSVACWRSGFTELAQLMAAENNLNIEWVQMLNPINCFIFGASDAMLAMRYNEYYKIQLCLGEVSPENVFFFSDHGYNFPEDGLYAMSSFCREHPSIVASFIRASIKGWQYAADHPDEALEILLKYMRKENVATVYIHQKYMLGEILDLQLDGEGKRSFAPISKECYKDFARRAIKAGLLQSAPAYSKLFLQ